MQSDIAQAISDGLASGSPWLVPLAFIAGLCTSLNPCAYPMIGAIAGYMWSRSDRSPRRTAILGIAFVVGLAAVYVGMGVVGSLVLPRLGLSRAAWSWIAGGICLAAGAIMAGLIHIEFGGGSALVSCWARMNGVPGALVIGVLMGLVATPCATPPLIAILSVASAQGTVGLAALLMLAYAVGHALPAVLVGLLAASLAGLERFAPYGRGLQIAGGWLLIAVGFYIIWSA